MMDMNPEEKCTRKRPSIIRAVLIILLFLISLLIVYGIVFFIAARVGFLSGMK